MAELTIVKRNGNREPYRAEMINNAIERACAGLTDVPNKVMKIIADFELTLYDGITTKELDQSLVIAASQNIKDDVDYDIVARNLLLLTLYKECLTDVGDDTDLAEAHRAYFPRYIRQAVKLKLLDARMEQLFDLQALSDAIDLGGDRLFKFLGLSTIYDRYLIRDREQHLIETPQAFWMRVAMGLALEEKEPTRVAIRFYRHFSALEYLPATPTLLSAGTPHSQLSSCYVMNMYDDIEHIGKTVSDVLLLSKFAGGIGVSVSNIRALGSYISTINGHSSGVVPFLKIIDVAVNSIIRGGKRRGAICMYMENWHYEFEEFLDLRDNAGDPYRRTYVANTAVWISDEFMRRVENNGTWTLFDPAEVKDLTELYGEAFSKRYLEYEALAAQGKLKMFKQISAREQFKDILIKLQTTSHPWITFKDAMNVRALTKNAGVIHSSNLCTEIALPNDRDNISVCNLASINLSRFVEERQINFVRLEQAVRSAVRGLDNVIDINFYPVPETKNSNDKNRPVGLGLMGFTETIERLNIPYGDERAYDLMDQVMEFISFYAIDESANLAQEKGAYPNFEGSLWSQGMVPFDTLATLEEERQVELDLDKKTTLDWDMLRKKVKKGMRNADLMAIAPNSTIGLIAGTTPGIDPNFSNIFSRNTLSGKFLEVNRNLVEDLKELGLWDKVSEKILTNRGELGAIEEIPPELKQLYQTSFEIDPEAFTTVAARAQKWIDQAISRNMYLDNRDISHMMNIYLNAWKKGLKSTYYLHMKQRHTAEQSTSSVNKRESLARKGFSGFRQAITADTPSPVVSASASVSILSGTRETTLTSTVNSAPAAGAACPVDPMERLQCESCQ